MGFSFWIGLKVDLEGHLVPKSHKKPSKNVKKKKKKKLIHHLKKFLIDHIGFYF